MYNRFTIAVYTVELGQDRKVAAIRSVSTCGGFFIKRMNKEDLAIALSELEKESSLLLQKGEVPVSAVLVLEDGTRIVTGNKVEEKNNPFLHAEIVALEEGMKKTGSRYLKGATLLVSLEPCLLCMGAILKAGIEDLYYCQDDKKKGALSYYHVFVDDVLRVHTIKDRVLEDNLKAAFALLRKD